MMPKYIQALLSCFPHLVPRNQRYVWHRVQHLMSGHFTARDMCCACCGRVAYDRHDMLWLVLDFSGNRRHLVCAICVVENTVHKLKVISG